MDLKKLTLVAVLAISQAASAVPAFAESVNSTSGNTNAVGAAATSATDVMPEATDPLPPMPTEVPGGVVSPTPTPTPIPGATAEPTTTTEPTTTSEPTATTAPTATSLPSATPETTTQPTPTDGVRAAASNQLVLMMNSNKMYQNGVEYLANQPMAVKNGVSYVSIRAMVERVGVKYIYDYKTKETIVTKGSDVMRFKTDSKIYSVNGKNVTMKGPAYQTNGTFMVPLTSITGALGIPYTVDNVQKRVILTLNTKPKASFTVPTEIYAGDPVNFVTSSSSPNGTAIVDERWEGNKQDIYDTPGFYVVSYSVMDANGQWSDPYSVTINVLKPNTPPVANFTTDKDSYKMGEMITYSDLSSDPDGDPIEVTWTNKAEAFFTPGPATVAIQVKDSHGAISTFEKTINISDEILYSKEDFYRLFGAPGSVFNIDGSMVPTWQKVAYNLSSEPYNLIRSNSPETVNTEGITYKETSFGGTRFLVHHKNNMNIKTKVYVIAKNNNLYPTTITTEYVGFGGPSSFPEGTGKMSVERYWKSMITREHYKTTVLQPGESVSILTDLNKIAMKPGEIVSLQADLFSDYPIEYNVMMIEANKDPLTTLPTLPILDRDGVHNRGTYADSTRIITVTDEVGTTPARLLLGDNSSDLNLTGVDPMNGTEASNAGNFGVLYKIKFDRVAPNSLITFNPRGGNYMGPVMVNGQIVQMPNSGSLSSADMNSVIYRTGDYGGSVEILFTAASGSNLPVNFLVTPLPAKK
ncbi:stalk domain-containing protein [Paenibacillus sp. FSL F4-0243]|uniref:copper amine oxidase N-terminal domain-containing protein n=1 Tax=Paenibacillus sp. FSL F4-0243 TaxID=2954732 RepID=UPI0030DB0181